jgi:ADP-heptose:LPS heptosyltransferase
MDFPKSIDSNFIHGYILAPLAYNDSLTMRILAANPDGLGDLILRQPLYSKLLAEGHELMLTVRRQWMEIAPDIIPGARLVPIEIEPYTLALTNQWDALAPILKLAQQFAPDVFLVTPFRWTLLEEWLAANLKGCRVLGMTGNIFPGDPRWGFKSQSQIKFDAQAAVTEDSTELAKNELLANLVLKEQVLLGNPKIEFPTEALSSAQMELEALGFDAGNYWIACVGNEPYKSVRNWKLENWAALLNHWALTHKRRFLLLGNENELETTEKVRALMDKSAAESAIVCCRNMPLRTLGGLIQLSSGYVGRDTGPMHLAAALGKPVISVFGGGHWPRFQPAAFPSWIGTVQVPCIGCDWQCAFEQSYCISEVPLAEVIKAVEDFEAGRLTTRVIRNFRPGSHLYPLMLSQVTKKRSLDLLTFAASSLLESDDRERKWNERFRQLQAGMPAAPLSKSQKTIDEPLVSTGIPLRFPWLSRTELESQVNELRSHLDEMPTGMDGKTKIDETSQGEIDLETLNLNTGFNEYSTTKSNETSVWPYAAPAGPSLPDTLPGGKPWPKISIITPTFNQGRFIEQTILSILNQNYPNLEYIIMDGGSQDETISVIDRYRDRINIIVSERDRGQSHAINKGFALATGELITWLNSDDMFEPGALIAMAMAFHTSGADVVVGICNVHSDGRILNRHLTGCASGPLPLGKLLNVERWIRGQFFYQPEAMFTRKLWERAGGKVDESLHYTMDCDLWFRFARVNANMHVIARPICRFRVHPDQKTSHVSNFRPELEAVCERYRAETGASDTLQVPLTLPRQHLRAVLLNENGETPSVSAALSLAGHIVNSVSKLREPQDQPAANQQILADIGSHRPDLIIVEERGEPREDDVEKSLANRWPIIRWPGSLSVPLDIFAPQDKSASRKRFGLPPECTIVLLAGSASNDPPAKLAPFVADLEPLVSDNLLIVSIGRFDIAPQKQSVRIWNLGESTDAQDRASAYCAADIVLDASSGIASLEAAACGIPSVRLEHAATLSHETSGFIATDSAAATSYLRQLIEDSALQNRMGIWAHIWAENEFSPASEFHKLFLRLDAAGLIDRLNLPPKISFQREIIELPEIRIPELGAVVDPALTSLLAALQAERDSLRQTIDGVTQTRLWRMVAVIYPKYQRILGSRGVPRFVRNGVQKLGNWFANRPKKARA